MSIKLLLRLMSVCKCARIFWLAEYTAFTSNSSIADYLASSRNSKLVDRKCGILCKAHPYDNDDDEHLR